MQPTEVKSLYSLKDVPPWGHKIFDDFTKDMLSDLRPFPCVLGVEGFKQGSYALYSLIVFLPMKP